MTHQIVKLARDCSVIDIPSGYVHTSIAGTPLSLRSNAAAATR